MTRELQLQEDYTLVRLGFMFWCFGCPYAHGDPLGIVNAFIDDVYLDFVRRFDPPPLAAIYPPS